MKTFSALPRSFYKPSAKVVAPRLLGHWLIRHTLDGPVGGPIVEVEAYLRNDPACHGAPHSYRTTAGGQPGGTPGWGSVTTGCGGFAGAPGGASTTT